MAGIRKPGPVEPRFWAKVRKGPGCWLWTSSLHTNGYGLFAIVGRGSKRAHRIAWELSRGAIPTGLHVLHRCDVRACVNPDHLWLGTHEDNMADLDVKGRRARGERAATAKLTAARVRAIRAALAFGRSKEAIGRRFGVRGQTVADIATGKTWRHV